MLEPCLGNLDLGEMRSSRVFSGIPAPRCVGESLGGVLGRLSRSSSARHRTVQRATELLLAADGIANYDISRRVGGAPTRCGRGGCASPPRGSRTSATSPRMGAQVVDARRHGGGGGGRHAPRPDRRWLHPLDDSAHGRPPRHRQGFGGPHLAGPQTSSRGRSRPSTFSNDPRFEEKLVDVVGRYLDPPERAVVFSFDEKTQVQVLDRRQASLPLRPDRAGTMTHDYKRRG